MNRSRRLRATLRIGLFASLASFTFQVVATELQVQAETPHAQPAKEASPSSDDVAVPAVVEPEPVAPLNPALAARVRKVLDAYYLHPLNTRDDAPWSVLHWSIAYGIDATVAQGGPGGQPVTAIGWLCSNYPTAGQRLMVGNANAMTLPIAPGLQGHEAQFLSMLAQSHVKPGYLVRFGEQELTVQDLVEYEKSTCRLPQELTFKLLALSHYDGTEARWQNASGEAWSVERLLTEELKQPINNTVTCGGLHRLYALHFATQCHAKEGLSLTGPWQTASERTKYYQQRAFQLQNRDGSFSTAFLERPEAHTDFTRRITTTGHVMEWLTFSLTTEQLRDPRYERGLGYLLAQLEGKQDRQWHKGALGHALHALALYEQRASDAQPGQRSKRFATIH